MSSVQLNGDTSGSITLAAPAVAGSNTLTLPATTGTLVVANGAQTIEFADGTVSAPSITNSGDTNTGIWFPATDTIAFTEGGTESMRIDSSGNVGIGTASPSVKLDVNGITRATYFSLFENTAAAPAVDAAVTRPANGTIALISNAAERMRIDSSGNVGIGTTSPNAKLEIYKSTGSTLKVSSGDVNAYLQLATTSDGLMYLANESGAMNFYIANALKARFDSSGYFLINETAQLASSTSYLTITAAASSVFGITIKDSGTTYAATTKYMNFLNSSNAVAGSIQHTAVTTTAYATSSDARFKTNIQDSPSALAIIDDIKVRAYDWIDDGKHTDFGFVAQELHPYCPDAVSEGGDDVDTNPWQLEYGRLTPFLMKAVKELKEQNEALQARIEALGG